LYPNFFSSLALFTRYRNSNLKGILSFNAKSNQLIWSNLLQPDLLLFFFSSIRGGLFWSFLYIFCKLRLKVDNSQCWHKDSISFVFCSIKISFIFFLFVFAGYQNTIQSNNFFIVNSSTLQINSVYVCFFVQEV